MPVSPLNCLRALLTTAICYVALITTSNAQRPCNQLDEVEQTRCQIARAVGTGDLSLLKRIFEKSPYADINDRVACNGKGYMACARDISVARFLFGEGYDPAPPIEGRPQLSSFVIDGGSLSHTDDFQVALFKLFLENGADLLQPDQTSNIWRLPNPTTLSFLMMKCFQPHVQYPRYNRMIKIVVETDTPGIRSMALQPQFAYKYGVLRYLAMSVEKGHPASDIKNCSAMLDWARAEYSVAE